METRFPVLSELNYLYDLERSHSRRFFPEIRYKTLTVPDSAFSEHDIHAEVAEYEKTWSGEILVHAFVAPREQTHPLTVFGIEELRDAVLFVAVPILLDLDLASRHIETLEITLSASVGDRFIFSGVEYDVLEWKRGPSFANTDVPLFYEANSEKVRREAFNYERRI